MPGNPVVLDSFGGIVATARPEDLPDGASPRNNDVDFIVGRFIQRPGLQSVYENAATIYGPNGGNLAENLDTAAAPWTNPDNILLEDGSFTTISLSGHVGVDHVVVVPGTPISGTVMVYATGFTTAQSGSGLATNTDRTCHLSVSNPGGIVRAHWDSYVAPTLPAGAIITAIEPVLTGTGDYASLADSVAMGVSLPGRVWSGTFIGGSIGTSSAIIPTWEVDIFLGYSLPFPPPFLDTLVITDYGLRVSYTVPATGTGGYYALSETPIITFTGAGAGATGVANTTTVGAGPGAYKFVSSVTVTAPGNYVGAITGTFTGAASHANDAIGIVFDAPVGQISDHLRVTDFRMNVPSTYLISGIEVAVKGLSSDATTLNLQMVKASTLVGDVQTFPLPDSNAFITLGGPTYLFGTTWTFTDVDSTDFGIELWVTSAALANVSLDYAEITIYGTPTPANYLGIVSANLDETDQTTIVLDSNGISWKEDVTNLEGTLAITSAIPKATPGAYLKGLDADGKAYMVYTDLTQGISQPMQFNGSWSDRITQVGPGIAPSFTPQQSTSDTFAISTITQPTAAHYGFIYFLQSSGPGSTAPGNVITIYYGDSTQPNPVNLDLVAAMATGFPVYLYILVGGIPVPYGPTTVQVTSIGEASPPGQPRQFYYFTFVVSGSAFTYYQGSGHPGYVIDWTRSLATMKTTNPVPGLLVGNQVTVTGAAPPDWDSTWTISQTLDSGQMAITATSVTAGIATYNYAVQTGANPAAGELVTVTGTTNANGALNVANATIASSTGGGTGSFTVAVPLADDSVSVPESGQATTAGTLFAFDPGALTVNTATSPIYGADAGGNLTFEGAAGQNITPGTKQGSVFFITRNGAVVRPAPPTTFTVPSNCGAILCTHIPVGPPNVVARGITFTESGQNGVAGANFYYYDTPESFYVNGVKYTSDALILPDNTSTTATFSFSDSVLLASDEIDIPGNNYFNLIELGNPAWIFQYASRMLYGLCQTKIQNLINMSFDGGYQPTYSSTALPLPAGWSVNGSGSRAGYAITGFSITSNIVTFNAVNSLIAGLSVIVSGLTTGTYLNGNTFEVLSATGTTFTVAFTHANVGATVDAGVANVNNSSIGLVTSLDFGNAFRMINYGTSVWTEPRVLFQPAYQDYLGVNVIQPNTPYSVRVKARAIGTDAQQVTITLPTYANQAFGPVTYGTATFSFEQGSYVIKTGTLITGTGLVTVNSALQVALGVKEIAIGSGVEVDRIEIYPTNRPIDTTTIWTSYANKFESVDIVTGQLGVGAENPQPATGAFDILEQLYIEKTRSLQVTQDSPNYEPNNWQVRQASDRAGACGPNAFDEGEEFAVSANRNGVYYFDGGKPMPILRELQSTAVGLNLWEYVNWNYGQNIWIRNDLNNRRLLIGLPLNVPNPFLPNADLLSPSSPNVILMCNYTGCPTGAELADSSEVHMTMFGDLKALDMKRKWSIWQIPSPIAEFVPRRDLLTAPLFLCNGIDSNKIYQLINGSADGTGQNTDDGAAINWSYTTAGLVKAKAGQQLGLGALRKIWYYLAATMEGAGQVAGKLYSNSLGALPRNTFTIPLPFTLSYPQQNDQERTLEFGGQRMFIEFSSIGTGGYAEIGPVMVDGEVDKVSPHRGVAQ